MAWQVQGTKKGGLPLSVEKRPLGKYATLIRNVTNAPALTRALRNALGCGGISRGPVVELQGDMVERVQAFLLAREECLVGVQGHGAKEKKKRIKEEAALREAVAQAEEDALRRRERMRERKPRHEKKKRMAPILPENTQWEVSADSVLDPVVWWEDIAIVDDGGADDSPGERACQLPYNASQVDAGLQSLGLLAVRVDVGLQRDDLFRSRKKEKTQERQARRAQVRNEELRSRAAMYLAGHGRNNTTPARAKSEAPAQRWGWDAMMDGLTETGGVRPSAGAVDYRDGEEYHYVDDEAAAYRFDEDDVSDAHLWKAPQREGHSLAEYVTATGASTGKSRRGRSDGRGGFQPAKLEQRQREAQASRTMPVSQQDLVRWNEALLDPSAPLGRMRLPGAPALMTVRGSSDTHCRPSGHVEMEESAAQFAVHKPVWEMDDADVLQEVEELGWIARTKEVLGDMLPLGVSIDWRAALAALHDGAEEDRALLHGLEACLNAMEPAPIEERDDTVALVEDSDDADALFRSRLRQRQTDGEWRNYGSDGDWRRVEIEASAAAQLDAAYREAELELHSDRASEGNSTHDATPKAVWELNDNEVMARVLEGGHDEAMRAMGFEALLPRREDFDWRAFLSAMGDGRTEGDALMFALEQSLDAVARRDG